VPNEASEDTRPRKLCQVYLFFGVTMSSVSPLGKMTAALQELETCMLSLDSIKSSFR
jgi:hypothetical protein